MSFCGHKIIRRRGRSRRNDETVRKKAPQDSRTWSALPIPHVCTTLKEKTEGGNDQWRMRTWETSAIEIWGTTRDLGFPVSKDKDLVRSVRDTAEDRQMNLDIDPEILSFCRRKMEEWDQKVEPDLCTREVQELVGQWSLEDKSGDLTQSDQEDGTEGHCDRSHSEERDGVRCKING